MNEPSQHEREQHAVISRQLFLTLLTPTKPSVEMARRLAAAMREVRLVPGETLWRKGDPAEHSYFIAEGTVTLDDDGADPVDYQVGDVVGIVDLNLQRPRGRRAVAATDAVLLELRYDVWLEVQEDNVEWVVETRRVVSQMVHDSMLAEHAAGYSESPPSRTALSPARPFESTMIETIVLLGAVACFERAGVEALAELARRAQWVSAAAGAVVVPAGSSDRSVFVVAAGSVCAVRQREPLVRATYEVGALVLDGAAFSGALREYEVVALQDATLLRLGLADVDDVIEDHFALAQSLLRGISIDREHWMDARRQRSHG